LPADRSVAVPELVLELVVAALGCGRRGVVSAALLLGGLALEVGLAFQALAFGTDALVCLADDSIQELLQSRSRARLDLADDDPVARELHLAPTGCARGGGDSISTMSKTFRKAKSGSGRTRTLSCPSCTSAEPQSIV
jgi:hypothetical protein